MGKNGTRVNGDPERKMFCKKTVIARSAGDKAISSVDRRPGLLRALSFLFAFLLLDLSPAQADGSLSAISERFGSAVVAVMALDEKDRVTAFGSGFFVNDHGALATNYHVLEKASKAIVCNARGEEGQVLEITHADPDLDLLIALSSFSKTIPVRIGDSDAIREGQRVVVMGNSPRKPLAFSSGTITHFRKAGDLTLFQMNAPILPGWSGGPVFNLAGEVIGIATAYLDFAHFAVPANRLKTLKAHPSPVHALRGISVKLAASLVDNTLVEILVKESASQPPEKPKASATAGPHAPLTVHFKDGRKLLCDWVWKEGSTLFLVVQGRSFAVGYDLDLIDVTRSPLP